MLALPLNTVRSRLFRARGAMRHVLNEEWGGERLHGQRESSVRAAGIQAWVDGGRLAAQEAKVVEAHVKPCGMP